MLRRVIVENGLVEGLPAADPRITSLEGIPFAAPRSAKTAEMEFDGNPNGKDDDGSDTPLWKPFTKDAPNRKCFNDRVYLENKCPRRSDGVSDPTTLEDTKLKGYV